MDSVLQLFVPDFKQLQILVSEDGFLVGLVFDDFDVFLDLFEQFKVVSDEVDDGLGLVSIQAQ